MAQMANIPPLNKINKFKPEMCILSIPLSGIELPHRPRTFPNFLGSTSPPGSSLLDAREFTVGRQGVHYWTPGSSLLEAREFTIGRSVTRSRAVPASVVRVTSFPSKKLTPGLVIHPLPPR